MKRQMALFPSENAPRRPRRRLMHVMDAGQDMVLLECGHCGYSTGWIAEEHPVSVYKRGLPCPDCNAEPA